MLFFRISKPKSDDNDVNLIADETEDIYPETETLSCLANSVQHQHLLKHPVIVLFLMIKWKHLNFAYTLNLLFYLTFVTFITAYIYFVYDSDMPTNCQENVQVFFNWKSRCIARGDLPRSVGSHWEHTPQLQWAAVFRLEKKVIILSAMEYTNMSFVVILFAQNT